MNFYKHHIGDYDSHTLHLSWSEDLVYRRLLCAYYLREKPLPADMKILRRMVRATEAHQVRALTTVIESYFVLCDGAYHNERCDIEIEKYQAQCSANRITNRNRFGTKSEPNRPPNRLPNQKPEPDITTTSDIEPTRDEQSLDPFDGVESQNHDDYPEVSAKPRPQKINGEKWWSSHEGIDKKGRELGVMARGGEDYPTFKDRLFQIINERRRNPNP